MRVSPHQVHHRGVLARCGAVVREKLDIPAQGVLVSCRPQHCLGCLLLASATGGAVFRRISGGSLSESEPAWELLLARVETFWRIHYHYTAASDSSRRLIFDTIILRRYAPDDLPLAERNAAYKLMCTISTRVRSLPLTNAYSLIAVSTDDFARLEYLRPDQDCRALLVAQGVVSVGGGSSGESALGTKRSRTEHAAASASASQSLALAVARERVQGGLRLWSSRGLSTAQGTPVSTPWLHGN